MIAYFLNALKIWDFAPHNAFTSLTRHQGHFYCTFREGSGHFALDGKIRVLVSEDGRGWGSATLIDSPDANCPDLRDPKIGITPDGALMLMAVAAFRGEQTKYVSYAWRSVDGVNWDEAVAIGEPDVWMWNFTCEGEALYGVGHAEEGGVVEGAGVRLYRNDSGESFEYLTTMFQDSQLPNETALSFHDGQGVALVRHDLVKGGVAPELQSFLGTSSAPYSQWSWFAPVPQVGGPALIRLPDGRFIAGGRMTRAPQAYTALWEVDVKNGQLHELIILPSLNDNGYPGLAWHDDLLWVSYYSGHEGKPCIYIAQLKIE